MSASRLAGSIRPSAVSRAVAVVLAMAVATGPVWAGSGLADLAEHQNWAELQQTLATTPDLNATQVDGMTALHWAVRADQTEVVKTLLEAGASATVANLYGGVSAFDRMPEWQRPDRNPVTGCRSGCELDAGRWRNRVVDRSSNRAN